MNAYDSSDMDVFLSDFGTEIIPMTWGTDPFRGIVERQEIEVLGSGGVTTTRYRTTVITDNASIPEDAVEGDRILIDGGPWKIVEYLRGEPGMVTLILARVA